MHIYICVGMCMLRAGRCGGRVPVGGEIFRTHPDRFWIPPSLLYNGYRVFPWGKAAGLGVDHPTPFGAEVKERVYLYLYSPCGPSWPVLGCTLPLTINVCIYSGGWWAPGRTLPEHCAFTVDVAHINQNTGCGPLRLQVGREKSWAVVVMVCNTERSCCSEKQFRHDSALPNSLL
jgi:hypothetical protein